MALYPSMSGIERSRSRRKPTTRSPAPALLAKQAVPASAEQPITAGGSLRKHREALKALPSVAPQGSTHAAAQSYQECSTAGGSLRKRAPPRGKHARTMTQWSPVKGANLLVDPRARQRKERREKRYPPPPVPPVEPPPRYDFSKRFRKPHATRGGADFGRSSVRAQRPGRAAMACCESVP